MTVSSLRIALFVCIVATGCATAAASGPVRPAPVATDSPPRIDAVPVPEAAALKLDGALNDAAWLLATPVSAFVQREPREGAEPSQATDVRVVFDDTYLYVAVRAWDKEPGKIVGIRTRRDLESPSDWLRVVVDSYHDRRTAYEFAVNPSGVKQDTYWFADGNADPSWDAVWDVSVTTDKDGWKAEFRIPFSQLRFDPAATSVFGFAVVREIGRLKEVSTWPLLAKSRSGFVSQFGQLGGLTLGRSLKRLELVPYVVGQTRTAPVEAGNPFAKSPDPGGSLGVDVKYALTPGLTATATANPDFGQVEADPAVVNLTAFETYYQERRPFFVEGSGNFTFDLDCNDGRCTGLFYSRRIGRTPRGEPDVPEGGFMSTPSQTTILGAAKVTGRVGAFSVGALSAMTAREDAHITFGSSRTTQTVEPFTAYTLFQAKREWKNQSSLGFIVTNTTRPLTDDVRFLPGKATTGGTSWDWRLRDARYAVRGYWAGSTVHGSSDAISQLQLNAVHNFQRPDAGHLDYDPADTAMNGHAGSVSLQKIGGKRVRFTFSGDYKSPGFEVNDVGYQRRADQVMQSAWVQIRWDTPTKLYRNVRFNLNQWAGWSYGGDPRFVGTNINAHTVLTSFWSLGAGTTLEGPGLDDRATRGGPAFRSKRGANLWYYVNSDERKSVSGTWQGFFWRDEEASWIWGLDPEMTWRPTSYLTVSGGLHFEKTNEDSQWVENVVDGGTTHHVFGRIRQTTVGVKARASYTISPTLSLQVYAEPFVSAGAYTEFRELAHPRAQPYAEQFRAVAYGGHPDFNYKSLRATNVLRWEYRPGSALFVVWQQGREDVSDTAFDGRRDMRRVFGLPASNVFLVKASYWFNF